MKREIAEVITSKTKHCQYNFECMTDDHHFCMERSVERSVFDRFIYLDCRELFCKHHMRFGQSDICNCPTRIEIFNKYHI